jgi:hypothetical protein
MSGLAAATRPAQVIIAAVRLATCQVWGDDALVPETLVVEHLTTRTCVAEALHGRRVIRRRTISARIHPVHACGQGAQGQERESENAGLEYAFHENSLSIAMANNDARVLSRGARVRNLCFSKIWTTRTGPRAVSRRAPRSTRRQALGLIVEFDPVEPLPRRAL